MIYSERTSRHNCFKAMETMFFFKEEKRRKRKRQNENTLLQDVMWECQSVFQDGYYLTNCSLEEGTATFVQDLSTVQDAAFVVSS